MVSQLSLPLIPGMVRSASRILGFSDSTSTIAASLTAVIVGASQDISCRGMSMGHIFESAITLSHNISLLAGTPYGEYNGLHYGLR